MENLQCTTKDFLEKIKEDMKNQNEVTLRYKNFSFVMQPSGENIEVYSYGKTLANYNSFDEFLFNFQMDGHLFMEVIDELDFDD